MRKDDQQPTRAPASHEVPLRDPGLHLSPLRQGVQAQRGPQGTHEDPRGEDDTLRPLRPEVHHEWHVQGRWLIIFGLL